MRPRPHQEDQAKALGDASDGVHIPVAAAESHALTCFSGAMWPTQAAFFAPVGGHRLLDAEATEELHHTAFVAPGVTQRHGAAVAPVGRLPEPRILCHNRATPLNDYGNPLKSHQKP